jgi:hypothetical protein
VIRRLFGSKWVFGKTFTLSGQMFGFELECSLGWQNVQATTHIRLFYVMTRFNSSLELMIDLFSVFEVIEF